MVTTSIMPNSLVFRLIYTINILQLTNKKLVNGGLKLSISEFERVPFRGSK